MNFSYTKMHATSAARAFWHTTSLSFHASFLENPCEYPHIVIILPETRVPKVLKYMIVVDSFGVHFTLLFSKAKERSCRCALSRATPLSFDVSFLENPRRCSARNFSSTKDPQSFRGCQIFCGSRSASAHLCWSRDTTNKKYFRLWPT